MHIKALYAIVLAMSLLRLAFGQDERDTDLSFLAQHHFDVLSYPPTWAGGMDAARDLQKLRCAVPGCIYPLGLVRGVGHALAEEMHPLIEKLRVTRTEQIMELSQSLLQACSAPVEEYMDAIREEVAAMQWTSATKALFAALHKSIGQGHISVLVLLLLLAQYAKGTLTHFIGKTAADGGMVTAACYPYTNLTPTPSPPPPPACPTHSHNFFFAEEWEETDLSF
jgi:hypothetical protein